MRTLLLITLLVATAGLATGQRWNRVFKDSIPFPEDKNYFADRRHARFWLRTDTGWQMLKIPHVHHAYEWEGKFLVKTGDMRALVDPDGRVLYGPSHYIRKHGDLFLGFVCGKGSYLQTDAGDTLAFIPGHPGDRLVRKPAGMIDSAYVYCLAKYYPELASFRHDEIHTYGLIDGQGNWRIPPKYDAPFRLEEGVAQVQYKGEKFWIDASGKRVSAPPKTSSEE
ncbi:MAG: WG repeat-containing protein [Bacteroidota bacterium]